MDWCLLLDIFLQILGFGLDVTMTLISPAILSMKKQAGGMGYVLALSSELLFSTNCPV